MVENLDDGMKNKEITGNGPVPMNIADKAMKSICKINYNNKGKNLFGTGFFIRISDSLEYLITNYHIIKPDIIHLKIEIEIWNKNGAGTGSYTEATQDDHDIWKHIQGEYAKGWYIPSRGEWGAFADYFKKRTENKLTNDCSTSSCNDNGNYDDKFGLSSWYWSSSQDVADGAWSTNVGRGRILSGSVGDNRYVRLGATF